MKNIRLAVYAMHPIQYQAPIFRELDNSTLLKTIVLYGDKLGLENCYISEFKTAIKWDIPLLDGYKSKFFRNLTINRLGGLFSRINPGMFFHVLINRYDAVLIHGYQTLSAWLVLFAAKIVGTKVIFRGEATAKSGKKNWKQLISTKIAKTFLSLSDAVMYSCSGNKSYWNSLGVPEEKMFFIPCAVDNKILRSRHESLLPERKKLRSSYGIGDNDFVILFAARFTRRKRPVDLIKAVSTLNNKEIVLLFVGDGPEKEEMEKQVGKEGIRAIFTGFINQAQLPEFYCISDMFAIISSYDPSPKALNEALNFSLPVIATSSIGTAFDLIKEGENGFVVEVGDIEKISMHIGNLMANSEARWEMGCASKTIVSDWCLENDVRGIEAATLFVMNQNRNSRLSEIDQS